MTVYRDIYKRVGADFVETNLYKCESSETKPAEANENDMLIELDTGKEYYWSKSQEDWKEVGYNVTP